MQRPVERFSINLKAAPDPAEREDGARPRASARERDRVGGIELAMWAFSMALLAYAGWMVLNLWLYP